MSKYTIGVDFGTLSGRAVLVDVSDGSEIAQSVYSYPHGVMDKILPSGKILPPDWALAHPQDYIDVLYYTIPEILKSSGINPKNIIGIGIDATSCTLLPVKKDGTALCVLPEYSDEPHAYAKLWKHHATQNEADYITSIAKDSGQTWLDRYGGKVFSEWMLPKALQLVKEAPEIYNAADELIEIGDWLVWKLCGRKTRSACSAGYKSFWNKKHGYPGPDFYKSIDVRLENLMCDKFSGPVLSVGSKAGELTADMADRLGLLPGTPVASANVDAHASVPAVINDSGKLLAIIGTSSCHMVMSKDEHTVPGICGYVEDGILPGFFGYEAGQSCVGDMLAWFTSNCIPQEYQIKASENNMDIHQYLTKLSETQNPGENGLIALDWFGGNRSILADSSLSGLILGITLSTRPEDIYRALIEATAFGTRVIVENFRKHGIEINSFYAAGGIAQKNSMMMQIYADVLKMPVHIASSKQCAALGSAITAAVAAGHDAGGYNDIFTASKRMAHIQPFVYNPNIHASEIYDTVYNEYLTLQHHFAQSENYIMKHLRTLRNKNLK